MPGRVGGPWRGRPGGVRREAQSATAPVSSQRAHRTPGPTRRSPRVLYCEVAVLGGELAVPCTRNPLQRG